VRVVDPLQLDVFSTSSALTAATRTASARLWATLPKPLMHVVIAGLQSTLRIDVGTMAPVLSRSSRAASTFGMTLAICSVSAAVDDRRVGQQNDRAAVPACVLVQPVGGVAKCGDVQRAVARGK